MPARAGRSAPWVHRASPDHRAPLARLEKPVPPGRTDNREQRAQQDQEDQEALRERPAKRDQPDRPGPLVRQA